MERAKTILDKNGARYCLEIYPDEDGVDFKVFIARPNSQRTRIGYAYCWYEGGGTLLLADIKVSEDAVLVHRRPGLLGMFLEPKREIRNFRGLGIGTELLKCVVDFAKSKGMAKIVGKIKDVDYPKNPKLPHWYEQQGFTVTMESSLSAIRGWISRSL